MIFTMLAAGLRCDNTNSLPQNLQQTDTTMSDTNTAATAAVESKIIINGTEYEVKRGPDSCYVEINDQLRLVRSVVSGEDSPLNGAVSWRAEYATIGGYIERFGEDVVLSSLQANVAQRVYAKAVNRLKALPGAPKGDAAKLKKFLSERITEDPVIFTPEDALEFKLGEREASPAALTRQFAKLMKEATEATGRGDYEAARTAFENSTRIMEKLRKLQDELARAVESAEEAEEGAAVA